MNIDAMCSDAQTRVSHSINRSAGQHVRAMREMRPKPVRPTDRELLVAIESIYSVSAPIAFNWLYGINLKALQAELIEESK